MISGGKSFVSSPPAFSNDATKMLVCTGNTVSIFSTSTGLQVSELEGHTALVTSVIVVPTSSSASKLMSYCWTSSLDGTLRYWDFSLPELMKVVDVKLPIFSMVIPYLSSPRLEASGMPPNHFAFLSVRNMEKSIEERHLHGRICMVDLNKSRLVGGPLAETRKPEFLIISKSGEFFGILNKRKLHIWKVPAKSYKYDEMNKIKLHHTKNFTTLAFHPTERIVAGGDATGRILIWRNFGRVSYLKHEGGEKVITQEDRPGVRDNDDADSCSTWHWHPSEVKCLSFSSDGSYLFSGGREGTLVVWQLDTGRKRFLPRIGSPLLYFVESPDPTVSSVSCTDNQIHLLRMPAMEILKSISGIKPPCASPPTDEGFNGGFAFDHHAGLVALRTESYCIQFYSLFDSREVSQVRVYERNYQPVDDATVFVTLIALSEDGSKLGTVEVKLPEEGIGGLVALRFWDVGSHSGEYTLSTVIFEPHSVSGISAVAFHPVKDMAVSSSYSGDFKIWVYNLSKDQKNQKSGWRCQSVGSYKKRPMTAAAFSADGSVLAVAAEALITLWDPDTHSLISVIGETLTPITTLSFVGSSNYLLSLSRGSTPQLSVWDMSKMSALWSYKLFAEAVSCTLDGTRFAVLAHFNNLSEPVSKGSSLLSRDGAILLFSVENPVPMSTWTVKKAKGGGLGFVQPNIHDEIDGEGKIPSDMLVYINGDHEYVIFDPCNLKVDHAYTSSKDNTAPLEEAGQFGYASIYGDLSKLDSERVHVSSATYFPSDKPWETIFSGSSHLLPPLTKLCSTFLASLLQKKQSIQE